MRLKALNYCDLRGEVREWKLDRCTFGGINLVVGKNATGKTRVLNVISNLARLIAGKVKPYRTGEFDVEFEDGENSYRYVLHCKDKRVAKEEFSKNGVALLTREGDGRGKIRSEPQQQMIEFEPPLEAVAVAVRRDKIQHPFLDPLTQWAAHLHNFRFGTSLGKETIAFFAEGAPDVDPFDSNQLAGIFHNGTKKYGAKYTDAILADMKRIGYDIESVVLDKPTTVEFNVDPPGVIDIGNARWLQVKEKGVSKLIDQAEISQGMFRALSLIAQLNFSALALRPECILVDDIGEGLDFQRSCALIALLTEKASAGNIQLVMSTNDRFVMNSVPLEMWTVLQRDGSTVHAYNYDNSRKIFDDFSFTGLNNFDFLATDFLGSGGLSQ